MGKTDTNTSIVVVCAGISLVIGYWLGGVVRQWTRSRRQGYISTANTSCMQVCSIANPKMCKGTLQDCKNFENCMIECMEDQAALSSTSSENIDNWEGPYGKLL